MWPSTHRVTVIHEWLLSNKVTACQKAHDQSYCPDKWRGENRGEGVPNDTLPPTCCPGAGTADPWARARHLHWGRGCGLWRRRGRTLSSVSPHYLRPTLQGGSKGLKGRHSQDRGRNLSLYVTAYLSSNVLARVKCVRGAPRRGAPTGGVRRPPASSLMLACHVLSSILKFCLSAPLPLIQGGFWQYFIKCVKVNNR